MKEATDQPPFDFDRELQAGREFFSLRYLANLWRCSEDTIQRLVAAGDLETALDLAAKNPPTKAMIRIPRASVVAFLNRRKTRQPSNVSEIQ